MLKNLYTTILELCVFTNRNIAEFLVSVLYLS